MNRRTGVILLVMIAVLGGLIYYLNLNPDVANKPTPTSPPLADTTESRLWAIDPSQVESLTVFDSAKQLTFSAAVDSAGAWTISQPQAGLADSVLMSTYANTAASLTVTRAIEDVSNLVDFGLAAPAYSLQVKQKDGKTFRATIGKKAVTGASYYVLAEGADRPVLVPSGTLDSLLGLPAAPPLATPTPAVSQTPLPTLPVLATPTP